MFSRYAGLDRERNGKGMNLQKTFGLFSTQRAKLEKLLAEFRSKPAGSIQGFRAGHLKEAQNFGPNAGALRMFTYLPPQVSANRALVVVLHGCTQTAAGYDLGAGWSTLADRFGFALLLPEQQRSNNPNGCFNWFQPGDIARGSGEAASIRQMVHKMVSDHGIDRSRVFVTGLSAGGAMTMVMLAMYPEVFAGGAVIAGLPYGAANNVQQAFENMSRCSPRSARAWGDLVRTASTHNGPWPRLSVWHGDADATVIPANAREILKQWTDLHGLPIAPSGRAIVDGHPRQVWINEVGDELIESYTIPQMAHGTPLASGDAVDQCGAAGPFLLEVGISSSYHIAKFFGLTSDARRGASTQREIVAITPTATELVPQPHALEGEVLEREFDTSRKDPHVLPPSGVDIGAVITKALKAAGLMKSGRT
jgi:feruloyl esterase